MRNPVPSVVHGRAADRRIRMFVCREFSLAGIAPSHLSRPDPGCEPASAGSVLPLELIPAAVTGLIFGLIADHISDQPANFVIPTYTDRRKHPWDRPSDQHSPDFLRYL